MRNCRFVVAAKRGLPECRGRDAGDVPWVDRLVGAIVAWIVLIKLVTLELSQSPIGWSTQSSLGTCGSGSSRRTRPAGWKM